MHCESASYVRTIAPQTFGFPVVKNTISGFSFNKVPSADLSVSGRGLSAAMTPDLAMPPEEHDATDFICRWINCGLNFTCLDELVNHLTVAHVTSQQGSYFCMWHGCARDKGFNARYKMLIHIRTHTNERPFVCSECGKRFSRQENLRIHARTHTGEKPYLCGVAGCTKAYSNSSDRFKHSRTHQVDKPYECRHPGCGKRYTDPSSLRKHVKIYGHSKKTEDTSMHSIPPPSISPSSSGSSSLGASPIPMTPTPPSLLPASFFPQCHQTISSMGGLTLSPSPSTTAWTVALQHYTENIRQYSDSFRQYQTDLLLRGGGGGGSGPVSPLDISFGSSGMLPYSPTSTNHLEEEDEIIEDEDMDHRYLNKRDQMDSAATAAALDLSMCQTPLDLSLPSARRRHQ